MSKNLEFFKKYRLPQWQEKRLRIMERAEFVCENCEAKDVTLNVHHAYYEKDRDPWDYPDESLHCLCEDCHKEAEWLRVTIRRQAGMLDMPETRMILGMAMGLQMASFPMVALTGGMPAEIIEGAVRAFLPMHLEIDLQAAVYAAGERLKAEGHLDGWALFEICKSLAKPPEKG